MKSGCAELWDGLGSACASKQDQEREEIVFIMGWLCTWDTCWGHPGSVLSRLISCPTSATPEFVPWEKIFLEGWGKCSWRVGEDSRGKWSCPDPQPRSVCFVPSHSVWSLRRDFPTRKTQWTPRTWRKIFLLPYLLQRGERGRMLDLEINQMALWL